MELGISGVGASWEVVWGSSPWDPASLVVVVVPKVEGIARSQFFTTRQLFTCRVTLGDSGSVISVLSFASGVACRAMLAAFALQLLDCLQSTSMFSISPFSCLNKIKRVHPTGD